MRKHLIGIIILSMPVMLMAQQENTEQKELNAVVRQKIQAQLENAILTYKQFTCPEIKDDEYAEKKGNVIVSSIQAKGFFLPDSINNTSYQLIFDSIEPWGPQPSNYGYYIGHL